jgi:SprT protein
MSKKEAPLEQLNHFIPPGSSALVMAYLHQYKVHLTVTRERKTVLGDYRNAVDGKNHRITLIHELAHLVTFMEHGHRVKAHGKEWKLFYAHMLRDFLCLDIFPEDIRLAFRKTIHDLPASSCADEGLTKVLRNYDHKSNGLVMVEELPPGGFFETNDQRVFRKGKKLRKRFECTEVATGKLYLFSPIYEVKTTVAS